MTEKRLFYRCSKCGKILIERRPNGCWLFVFGKHSNGIIPVELMIHGNVKMRCLRRSCRRENPEHYNIFNLFPSESDTIDDRVESLTGAQ